jgi:hypothetical protein
VIDILRVVRRSSYYSDESRKMLSRGFPVEADERETRLYPADPPRLPPSEVTTEEIRRDYQEAHAIAKLSTRGAAAVVRRA